MKRFLFLVFVLLLGNHLHGQQMNYELIDSVCMSSVVQVTTPTGLGSGFLVNSAGYILTNFHVIEDGVGYFAAYAEREIIVKFKKGAEYRVIKIVAYDPDVDLALLKIVSVNTPPLPLIPATTANGTPVGALGNPLGSEFTITSGIISNVNPFGAGHHYFQLSTPINPGNSGGPVVNMYGQVAGVVVATLNEEYFKGQQAMNMAIQIGKVKKFLQENNISFSTKPLIDPLQLKVRNQLTPEEKILLDSIAIAQVKAQMELQQMQQDHDRAMEKDREAQERKLQDQKNEQEIKLMREQYVQRKHLQDQQYLYDLQKIRDQMTRDRTQVIADSVRTEQNRMQFLKDRKEYAKGLPYRILVMVGGSYSNSLGAFGAHKSTALFDGFGFGIQTWMGYRVDITKKKKKDQFGRGSCFGIGFQPSFRSANYFDYRDPDGAARKGTTSANLEVEGGMILKEWFKLSGGFYWSTNSLVPHGYAFVRTGILLNMHPIYLGLTSSVTLPGPSEYLWYSAELSLGVRSGFGKWEKGLSRKVLQGML